MPVEKKKGRAVDWAVVRQRLETSMDAVTSLQDPADEARRRKIEARAKALERSRTQGRSDLPAVGSVHFDLGGKRFAMEARYVHELVPMRWTTHLPRAPRFVIGLYDLRGQVLPVFDLQVLLAPTTGPSLAANWGIVCGQHRPEFLIATSGMATIAPDVPQPVAPAETDATAGWIRGIAGDGTIIVDGAALVTDRQLFLEDQRNTSQGGGKEKG
ncbi:chemotaxis protein CheW [Chelativorans sp. M5D2P16]|uniref:chemotaxis protein CheW n=1 Tax=Chelativorans sp. M5D2P16 TaxID=3095678 RepID=UPI002ACAE4CF|nr:chemotaxis protein CheW [Chelativorans sp. M5D2P16]MDZ5696193.1 chemotaxis protein CheW [Chelativorans sp. M5D2P16]